MNDHEDRRAKLSAEKRALLEKRLKGLTAAAAEKPAHETAPESEPLPAVDLAERVQLCRSRLTEEPVPRLTPDSQDARKSVLRGSKSHGAHK